MFMGAGHEASPAHLGRCLFAKSYAAVMAEDSASASGQTAARRPIFRELDPDEGDELETTEIESLCMACGENVRRFMFLPTNTTGGIDSRVESPSSLLSVLLLAHNFNGGLSDGVQEMGYSI